MAKNREPQIPFVPESESGEEEDEEVEEEEASSEEEESEPEPEPQTQQVLKKPSSSLTPASLKKLQTQTQPESSDEEDSGSESDSEPDPKIKPLASKPISEVSRKQLRSKSTTSEPSTPVKSTASKRPAEDEATEGNNKKSRKKVDDSEMKPNNDDSKKQLFQRLWSEDDEIEILKGMIDYAAKKKADPVVNLNAFHDFIRKNLHVDVTRTQLQDKIRRLKKKYMNNKKKEKGGKDRTFTNPHEQKGYELSKKIWGNESGGEMAVVGSPKANGTAVKKIVSKKANVVENEGKDAKGVEGSVGVDCGEKVVGALVRLEHRGVNVEERVLAIGAELFERGMGIEGEEEWNRLRNEEMEIYMRQVEIKRAQTKLVMDAMKYVER